MDKMNRRKIMAVFISLFMAVSLLAGEQALLLLPDALMSNPAKSAAADKFVKVMNNVGLPMKTLPVSKVSAAGLKDANVILLWALDNYPPAVWDALRQRQHQGGAIIMQGEKASRTALTPDTLRQLELLAGIKYQDYVCDPNVGKAQISQYMFIRPDDAAVWGEERPPVFAAYAGEAFAVEPVKGAIAAASWVRRDRVTSDGPAVVVYAPAQGGKSVYLGYYPFALIAQDNRNDLPSWHARIMLEKLLTWCGVPVGAPAAKARYSEPLNMHPITPAFQCPRSLWLWNIDYVLSPTESRTVIKFCQDRRITHLYLCTTAKTAFEGKSRDRLREFIRAAHAGGLKVEALDGWNDAILPEKQADFVAALQRVIDYDLAVAPEERFDGFQSDVEPVTIKGYHASVEAKKKYDFWYIQLHDRCREAIAKSGLKNFVFGMAIAENYAFDTPDKFVTWNGVTANMLNHLSGIADYFAVMSYHDKASRIIRASAAPVDIAAKTGKKTWVGAETLDIVTLYNEPASLSFYEEGLDCMERELEKVYRHYAGNPGFGGLAIHHYESYRRLPDAPRSGAVVPGPNLTAARTLDQAPVYTLDQAEQVAYGRKNWRDAADLSARIKFAWNAQALMVQATVTDDKYCFVAEGEDLWKSDHLEVFCAVGSNEDFLQLGITPGDFKTFRSEFVHIWHPQDWTAEKRGEIARSVKVTTHRLTENSYRIECVIPAAVFGLEKLRAGDKLKLLIEVGDTDDPQSPAKSMISVAPKRDRETPSSYAILELK